MFKIEAESGEVWVNKDAVECLRSMGNGQLEVYMLCE